MPSPKKIHRVIRRVVGYERSFMPYEVTLPDIGEGVADAEILKWLVKKGEKVAEDQPLVEVMTEKANVLIPSPRAGTVSKILANEGEVVKVGQPIISIVHEHVD